MKNTYRSVVLKLMEPMDQGHLRLTLPTGRQLEFGYKGSGIEAHIRILNDDFFKKVVLHGDIGFGESYVDGDWDTEDVTAVIAWMILNVETHPLLSGPKRKSSRLNLLKLFNRFQHGLNANTLKGSKKNIQAHYDLGNDFFKIFLDAGMAYSSAYFKTAHQTLEEAQQSKYEILASKLRLRPTDHVLEIGGGWGSFASYAARAIGCHVTMITISKEQCEFAKERFRNEGLSHKVHVELTDYRHAKGKFHKIISIEMIEAVGHDYLPEFFSCCHKLLRKEGLLALQMILAPDQRYESLRRDVDWIQKHIFPGGSLPSFGEILRSVNKTGDLCLLDYEDITPFYPKTLALWRANFNRNAESVRALGFDDAFIRKWNYYFSYCEAAFSMRNISVAHAVFTRPNNHSL